ncbi:hypothetical protein RI129_006886 [Pyrocoelia pectoralis]|uniref:Uncharacterized protein n=1 Tax=Pyrocoelia pectoralis TaxID=417401 RepID=A0AAN7VHU8_9COLE
MATALVGLHAYTGCDTVSAFSGKGKVTPFNLVFGNEKFISLFSKIGVDVNLSDDLFKSLQEFTCQLYSRGTNVAEVNNLRYNLFRSKRGKIDSSQLPPCENVLRLHAKRANYQAFVWRQCLVPIVQEISLQDHGWTTDEEGNISITWMTVKSTPEAVLNKMSCKCKRKCFLCSIRKCSCHFCVGTLQSISKNVCKPVFIFINSC